MKVGRLGGLMTFVGLLVVAAPAFAHHGFGVEFDSTNCRDVKGTLTGITWENPHAYIDVDAPDTDGKVVSWHLEMVTPNALKRTGTSKQDFVDNFGKPIAVRACMAKVNSSTVHRGAASYLALPDGLIRLVGQGVEGRPDDQKHF